MALLVTGDYVTPQGFTVSSVYWRWVGLAIDVSNMSATVTLYGYVDAAAFAAKKENIAQKQISLTGMDFGAMAVQLETPGNDGLSSIIYTKLKADYPEFASATDV